MKQLVEFPLESGGSIWAEVEVPEDEAGVTRGGRAEAIPVKAAQSFEAALGRLRPAAEAIISQLAGLSDPPNEVKVRFGLKMSAEAGAIVASASAEANYTVTLTWIRKNKK
ncbi:MAG: hypothetical protein Kow0047_34630 [Anaerolineae bacterium]